MLNALQFSHRRYSCTKFWYSKCSCTKIWYSSNPCDQVEVREVCSLCLYWSYRLLEVELYQNVGTAVLAVPKFGTAVPPVTKLRCGKHAVCVYIGTRDI